MTLDGIPMIQSGGIQVNDEPLQVQRSTFTELRMRVRSVTSSHSHVIVMLAVTMSRLNVIHVHGRASAERVPSLHQLPLLTSFPLKKLDMAVNKY